MGMKVTPLYAGQLRYPIVVQQKRKATEPDEYGHVNTSLPTNWTDFCARRAEVIADGAREQPGPDGLTMIAVTTYTIRVRYDAETNKITPAMRLKWEGKILNLETVRDPNGTKTQILMTAIEETQGETDD